MRIAITGASGLIGTALSSRLRNDGHEVVPVVRRQPSGSEIGWSIDENRIDPGAFDDIDAVVHLAGAGIGDRRWTTAYKQELLSSRTVGTALVVRGIAEASTPPSVLLSASGVGYYGSSTTATFDETSPAGEGFLAEICTAWENAATAAATAATRVVLLRTGIVLSAEGGALKKQLPLFKLGLGGKMGSGRNWQSWIHIDDEVNAIVHLLSAGISGPVNLTAPNPVIQSDFAKALGRALGRPAVLPIPKFGPKLLLGSELAENLLFSGQKVVPAVLQADGFQYEHAVLADALRDLVGK